MPHYFLIISENRVAVNIFILSVTPLFGKTLPAACECNQKRSLPSGKNKSAAKALLFWWTWRGSNLTARRRSVIAALTARLCCHSLPLLSFPSGKNKSAIKALLFWWTWRGSNLTARRRSVIAALTARLCCHSLPLLSFPSGKNKSAIKALLFWWTWRGSNP